MAANPNNINFTGAVARNSDNTFNLAYPNGNKPSQEINPLGVHIAPDGIDAPGRGAEGQPFATPEYAYQNKPAGLDDHYYWRGGTHSSNSVGPQTGWNYAVEITRSGTQEKPSIFEPYPGEAVIMDQANAGGAFNIYQASWIIVRNFNEVRNCMGSAMVTSAGGGADPTNCTFDSNHIHTVDGQGGSNVGGIQLDDAKDCTVINNKIHGITVGGVPNGNAACIHGYRQARIDITQNTLYDAVNGVFHKLAAAGEDGLFLLRNYIYQCDQAVHYDIQGDQSPPHTNQRASQNIFDVNDAGLFMNTDGISGINNGFHVWNNTFVNSVASLASLANTINVNYFNNIFHGSLFSRAMNLKTATLATFFSDYNHFDVNCDRFQVDATPYNSLASWNSAQSQDANSTVGDPLFVDAAGKNFRLAAGSPALTGGRGGQYPTVRGAYITGNEQIGSTL